MLGVLFKLNPDVALLSHGEAPHYHRRYCVSLLSSAWIQVGQQLYGCQENWLNNLHYLSL